MPLKAGKNSDIEVVKTIATQNQGAEQVAEAINKHLQNKSISDKSSLWAEKAYRLILKKRMADVSKTDLKNKIEEELKNNAAFNIYSFINKFWFLF